jgi:hypothetical protein
MIVGSPYAKKEHVFLAGDAAGRFRWRGLSARLRGAMQAVVADHAPLGCEDETGFHFQDEDQARAFLSKHTKLKSAAQINRGERGAALPPAGELNHGFPRVHG